MATDGGQPYYGCCAVDRPIGWSDKNTYCQHTRRHPIRLPLPSFAAEFEKHDWSEDRIYRRNGIGAKLLDRENLSAELSGRNYSAESIGKILGGNMMSVLRKVLS